MKMKQLTFATLFVATLCLFASCGNKQNKQEGNATENDSVQVLEIDSLLANAETLVNQEVTIEGVCTHICAHGGTKLFLMGSDDQQVIRVEACELGSFDEKCPNNIVRVVGKLIEDRIDEAYLLQWEEELKDATKEVHGEGGSGCSTEKKARQETANTDEERIQDFRTKIADRKAKTGKEYLSFYHVNATSYEIK